VHGPLADALARDGIAVRPAAFGPLRDVPGLVRAIARVLSIIRAERVELLHANGPQTNVPAGLAGRLARVPVVWHARNLLTEGMRDVDRMLSPLATRIICNADAIRGRFQGSRAWDKSVTILNAVDTREFHPGVSGAAFRGEQGVPPGEPAVGLVGRVGLGKGHEHFVDAALALLDSDVPAHFLIVGDALFREDAWRAEALRRRIKDGGAADRIRFTGFRTDMPQVMRGLDVLVLASDAEPCGRVLFEAMASGTAIVATNSGGTPEIVRDGVEGLLVPPRDPGTLAVALATLLRDPALRMRLGRAGVERARREFTVERHVSRTLQVYAAALGGRR
jgi:glycosyltransferase involved in cell wall biosynthesis